MKKFFTTLILFAAVAVQAQQLPNGGFDNWKTACGSTEAFGTGSLSSPKKGEMRQRPGVEPTDWNGSSINQEVMNKEKQETLIFNDNEEGVVKMTNKFVGVFSFGSVAPGFINLATPWVYAVSTISKCDGGVYGGVSFTNKPDAIKGRYKRTDATGENSHIIVYLWNGTFTSNVGSKSAPDQARNNVDRAIMGIDENPTASGTLVAKCDYSFTSTTNNDWQEIVVPLEYVSDEAPEMMNTIISGGDYWTRANMQDGTTLYADDVQFVYYSTLSKLSYGGVLQTIPAAGGTLDLSHVEFDESALEYEFNGVSAKGVHSYDEESALLTITVSNDGADKDGLSSHTYYVQFGKPVVSEYTNDLTVSVNGETTAPQATTIQLIKELDGTTSFALNNFVLGGEIPVGNIKLTGVQVDAAGNISAEQTITIAAGDDAAYDYWLGPDLGEVPVTLSAQLVGSELVADIDIDMTASMGQTIKVTFAPTVSYTDGDVLAVEPGLKNVVLNRQFNAGWSTICLPFNVDIMAFGEGAVAQLMEFAGADAGTLYFSEATSIVANTPYLVNFANAVEGPLYFGVNVQENLPVAVTNGDWKFVGTYTGIAAPGMEGMYGVTEVLDEEGYQAIRRGNSQASINATRAYFENISGTYMQKSMRISLGGETTGIGENVDAEGLFPADVYSVDGRLVRAAAENLDGLAKGIYVVGNVKVLVK